MPHPEAKRGRRASGGRAPGSAGSEAAPRRLQVPRMVRGVRIKLDESVATDFDCLAHEAKSNEASSIPKKSFTTRNLLSSYLGVRV